MSLNKHNFNNRERKTIILLSVIVFFAAGIFFIREKMPTENQKHVEQQTNNFYTQKKPYKKWNKDKRYKNNYRKKNYRYEYKYKYQYKYYNKAYNSYSKDKTYHNDSTYRNDTTRQKRFFSESNKFKTLTVLDLNTVDSATLCRIPGIGKTISSIILRYRNRLGGFYSTEQLLECKYFTEDLLPWFKVDSMPTLRKININDDSLKVLLRHPYFTYEQAKNLKQYRRDKGRIKDEAAFRKIYFFTQEECDRLMPYIEF